MHDMFSIGVPPDDLLDLFMRCEWGYSWHATIWEVHWISVNLGFRVSALPLFLSTKCESVWPHRPTPQGIHPCDLPFLLFALQQRAVSALHYTTPLQNCIHEYLFQAVTELNFSENCTEMYWPCTYFDKKVIENSCAFTISKSRA